MINLYNLFEKGRPEFYYGLNYVYENYPKALFFGIGTWGIYNEYFKGAHSHLIGSLVEYGIIGFIYWIFMICITSFLFIRILERSKIVNILVVFIYLYVIWNILFSPFAGDHRFITPFCIMYLFGFYKTLR